LKIIYAIPGLGTTKELFEAISIPDHQLKILEWPVPEGRQNMSEYAEMFLQQIDSSQPVNLIGVSFGGMLCCELAEKIKVDKLVLISSCKDRSELPVIFKILHFLPIHLLFSDRQYRWLASFSRSIIGFSKNYMPAYLEMVRSMPRNYFIRCFNMIVTWKRKNNLHPIYHIHGDADKLLSCKNIKKFDAINGGTHAMIVNQAGEINKLLNTHFNGL
jgi:pimeloyl-ACP methyl ester carboxylesterase